MSYLTSVNNYKFLYFRTEATRASDDASGDSACFPASSLMGMQPTSNTALTLYFKSMLRGSGNEGAADALANLDNNDSVTVTISANTHRQVIQIIAESINSAGPGFIVVADDISTGTEYLTGISGVGTISVAAAYANSENII